MGINARIGIERLDLVHTNNLVQEAKKAGIIEQLAQRTLNAVRKGCQFKTGGLEPVESGSCISISGKALVALHDTRLVGRRDADIRVCEDKFQRLFRTDIEIFV